MFNFQINFYIFTTSLLLKTSMKKKSVLINADNFQKKLHGLAGHFPFAL